MLQKTTNIGFNMAWREYGREYVIFWRVDVKNIHVLWYLYID